MGLGMNRVKLGIVCALAAQGGTLGTTSLAEALEDQVAPTTVVRNLHELEDAGYVSGDLPRGDRRRRRTNWTLNVDRLHAHLRELIRVTTPPPAP